MDKATVLAWRLVRQGLAEPARSPDEYVQLVRRLQPIAPVANTIPGSPPRLVHRTTIDDGALADKLRSRAELLKGRFWGGNIGYVLADDLEIYGTAFRKGLDRFSAAQEQVYKTLSSTGPLTPRQLKQETGLLNKQIMPALHRMQQAFLVYEAQEDSSWERCWSLLPAEWPEVDLERRSWDEAAGVVLTRLVESHVFATFAQVRDWSRFPARKLRRALEGLDAAGQTVPCAVEGLGTGWALPGDRDLEPGRPEPAVHMLHRADPLVRSHATELAERFDGREVLQYLLIDGELRGAVCGHWRIGPHDVEDIVVDLPQPEQKQRRAEILAEVAQGYAPPSSRIRRYAGRAIQRRARWPTRRVPGTTNSRSEECD